MAAYSVLIESVVAQSANETFTLNLSVSGDNATPTTPTLLSATPITYSQIDVAWTAATDNIGIGGYQVYRDATAIATTTLTSFSDTGLSGSTTYTYTIRAFDISRNYSDLSNALATTTPGAPVVAPTPTSTPATPSPTRVPLTLEDLSISTTLTTARLEWETNRFSQFLLRWGRTTSFEMGYVLSDIFSKEHRTTIDGLEPGTRYEFELIGYNQRGEEFVLARDQFTTALGPDVTPPANVSNLTADVVDNHVQLRWNNPADRDFARVRVLRNHLFYPTDSADGFVVYQGTNEYAADTNPFLYSDRVFYTVFSFDADGNMSSGAIIAVDVNGTVILISEVGLPPDDGSLGADQFPVGYRPVVFTDLEFIQDGNVLQPNADSLLAINGAKNLTIRLAYELVPAHLKTITVTLSHPENPESVFSFLLRINKDKSAYEATLAPLEASGMYGVRVDIFDFKTEKLHTVTGGLQVQYQVPVSLLPNSITTMSVSTVRIVFISILLILLMMLVLWWALFRRRDREHSQ